MKKYECNYCKKNPGHTCDACSSNQEHGGLAIGSNLYAAEFLLYAFHFENEYTATDSKTSVANPLMMLVAEG